MKAGHDRWSPVDAHVREVEQKKEVQKRGNEDLKQSGSKTRT